MLSVWHRWERLTCQERTRWFHVWSLLPLVELSLGVFGLQRVQTVLERFTSGLPCRLDLPAAEELAHLFHSATHWNILPANCLARSLVLCWLLRNQSLEADLRIGVAKFDGHFAAHAWVEHMGVALEEDDVNSLFTAFDQKVPSPLKREL
jgi:hypothetical protein